MNDSTCGGGCGNIDRRSLLTTAAPACAAACLGLGKFPGLSVLMSDPEKPQQHKFDVPTETTMTPRQLGELRAATAIDMVRSFKEDLGEAEVVRLLNRFSAERGRLTGERQAASSPQNDFQTFVRIFRPPSMESSLTLDIVEDTEKVFAIEVRECLWAEVFKAAGMDGEIGHAAVCNMDYYWPPAFNPNFKMERDKTLMRGDDVCNHRYIDTA